FAAPLGRIAAACLRDGDANPWCADPPSGVMPQQLEMMMAVARATVIFGNIPEARCRTAAMPAGMAAAGVPGISLATAALVVVATAGGDLGAALAMAMAAATLVAALSAATLCHGSRRARCRAANRNRAMCDAGDRGRTRDRGRRTDISPAAERDVVAGDVVGIGDKALARGLDLCLVRSERVAGVAVQDALQAMDGVVAVGQQRAAEQFVVEPGTEHAALAVVEGGAELLIVLDFRDERLQLARRRVVAGGNVIKLIVDDVTLGEELGPEIGLRLVVLVVRDRAFEIGRHLGKSAGISRIAVATRSGVQRRVALHDVDNVEQVVVGRT